MKLNELATLSDAELGNRKLNKGIAALKGQFQIALTHTEQALAEVEDKIDTTFRNFVLSLKSGDAEKPNVVISEIINAEEEKERLLRRQTILQKKMDELF